MKKIPLAALGALIALTALPAIADGTADQLRTRRTDLLKREVSAPSVPIATGDLAGREGQLSVGRVLPRLDPAPSVPVLADEFTPSAADAMLEPAEGIIVPDVKVLDVALRVAVPAEQLARIRQEMSAIHVLDLPVEAR